jgi:hypothetical protein
MRGKRSRSGPTMYVFLHPLVLFISVGEVRTSERGEQTGKQPNTHSDRLTEKQTDTTHTYRGIRTDPHTPTYAQPQNNTYTTLPHTHAQWQCHQARPHT